MSNIHQQQAEGTECLVCYDDIIADGDDANYVEYRGSEEQSWKPSNICQNCVEHMLSVGWQNYVDGLGKATCAAEMKRLLDKGPPINLRDPAAFPVDNDNKEVYQLWFSSDQQIHSAKLTNSLEGEERTKWWNEKLAFKFEEDEEEKEKK